MSIDRNTQKQIRQTIIGLRQSHQAAVNLMNELRRDVTYYKTAFNIDITANIRKLDADISQRIKASEDAFNAAISALAGLMPDDIAAPMLTAEITILPKESIPTESAE